MKPPHDVDRHEARKSFQGLLGGNNVWSDRAGELGVLDRPRSAEACLERPCLMHQGLTWLSVRLNWTSAANHIRGRDFKVTMGSLLIAALGLPVRPTDKNILLRDLTKSLS